MRHPADPAAEEAGGAAAPATSGGSGRSGSPPPLPEHLLQGPSRPAPDAGPSRKYKPPVSGDAGRAEG